MSYSIEVMKRSAFYDELVNNIDTMPPDKIDANIIAVRDYLIKRMKEIDAFHDELVNNIDTMSPDKIDANIIAVRDYLIKRMKEIDRNTK